MTEVNKMPHSLALLPCRNSSDATLPEVSEAQSAYLLRPVTCDRQEDLQLRQSDLRHGNDGVGQDAERRRGIYTP